MSLTLRRLPASCLALLVVMALLPSARASAAAFEVNSEANTFDANPGDGRCADANDHCSLRAALGEANALPGHDLVEVAVGTFMGDLDVRDGLTLVGGGPEDVVIVGGDVGISVSCENYDYDRSVRVSNLRIHGASSAGIWACGAGELELSRVIITQTMFGVWIPPVRRTRIEGSTIHGNELGVVAGSADSPGACPYSKLDLVNSTVSGNVWGVVNTPRCIAEISIVGSTISDNELLGVAGPAVLRATIVTARVPGRDSCNWGVSSDGYTLSDGTCFSYPYLWHPTDLPNVDPLLGPLQNHGGPTWTHALLLGSPAKNAIPVADCTYDDDGDPGTPEVPLATDQRGVARPQGAGCDIGSFEQSVCGLGAELAMLLPLLEALRRRRA